MQPGSVVQERDARLQEVERLIASPLLHGAESLCNLLRFLARHAIEHPGVPIKEYQIATELFGRPADFDPRLDSSVRVQTGRLRAKLHEYYAGPGADDRIMIEVPKGTYSLLFHEREPDEVRPLPPPPIPRETSRWRLLAAVAAIAAILGFASRPYIAGPNADPPEEALRIFWDAFLRGSEPPLVVYSNAAFVGRPELGMRYFDPVSDTPGAILDHYTGVGEVMAIHRLDQVFASLRRTMRVKRGRLLTWDDAKSSNLIFIGSTSENLSLRELPGTQEFVFRLKDSDPRKGDLIIANRKPAPGEPHFWAASEALPVSEDYAIAGLLPGLEAGNRILVLAGTTTLGTQAAVEYLTEAAHLEELLPKVRKDGRIAPFEAVLRIKISGGVPVRTQLVALRRRG